LPSKKYLIKINDCCIKCLNEQLKFGNVIALNCKECGAEWQKDKIDGKEIWFGCNAYAFENIIQIVQKVEEEEKNG